jgi:hypothetical protein
MKLPGSSIIYQENERAFLIFNVLKRRKYDNHITCVYYSYSYHHIMLWLVEVKIRESVTSNEVLQAFTLHFVLPIVYGWENYEELYFMQDGAPTHFALPVRVWLDSHFPGWWIELRRAT